MLNIAVIMGRLVADPELRHTPSDVAVTRFRVAVDRSYNKPGTERQADFIDVTAWRSSAEFVCKYFQKGSMIAVQGRIQTGSYTDNNGVKRYTTEIVADEINFTGSKRENQGNRGDEYFGDPPPERARGNAYGDAQSPSFPPPDQGYASGSEESFEETVDDEDLPF